MSLFIHKNRIYFLFPEDSGSNDTLVQNHTVSFVECDYGLLVGMSYNALNVVKGRERSKACNNALVSFAVINSVHKTISIALPTGTNKNSHETTVATLTLKELNEFGGDFVSATGPTVSSFVSIMLKEGKTPREIYEAFSRTMYVGSSYEAFMKNSKGLDIEELFKHPFAKKMDVFA